ncbi:MAG: hypothetical protein NTY69_01385 [Methylococcales bacterium]|nr:hypothetical protein [Methylococcales bacterium]
MNYEKNDVDELYKSLGIKDYRYVEIQENEEIIQIINKWALVKEIINFCSESQSSQEVKTK